MSERATNLENAGRDYAIAVGKSLAGLIPFCGQALTEALELIPGQRLDRAIAFLEILGERVECLEGDKKARVSQGPGLEIIDEAIAQAARAPSVDRLTQIASVVVSGLSAEQLDLAETKRMLWLLEQLSDSEIVILRSAIANAKSPSVRRGQEYADRDFRNLHEALLFAQSTHGRSLTVPERRQRALVASYVENLERLRVVGRMGTYGRDELVDPRMPYYRFPSMKVLRLGLMLLEYTCLIPDWYRAGVNPNEEVDYDF